MLSFEEYKEYYNEHKKCIDDYFSTPYKKELNEKQIESHYKKYLKRNIKKGEKLNKKDEIWESVKNEVNLSKCLLVERLEKDKKVDELKTLKENAKQLINTIDPAHVFSRGAYPELKYDIDNIVPLNRFSHSMLDQMRDPITSRQITKEEHDNIWKYIIGEEKYNMLKGKTK